MNKLILQKKEERKEYFHLSFHWSDLLQTGRQRRLRLRKHQSPEDCLVSVWLRLVSSFSYLLSCSTYFVVLPACLPAHTPVSIQTLKGDRNLPRQEKRGRAKGKKKLSAENKISICTSPIFLSRLPSDSKWSYLEICRVFFFNEFHDERAQSLHYRPSFFFGHVAKCKVFCFNQNIATLLSWPTRPTVYGLCCQLAIYSTSVFWASSWQFIHVKVNKQLCYVATESKGRLLKKFLLFSSLAFHCRQKKSAEAEVHTAWGEERSKQSSSSWELASFPSEDRNIVEGNAFFLLASPWFLNSPR